MLGALFLLLALRAPPLVQATTSMTCMERNCCPFGRMLSATEDGVRDRRQLQLWDQCDDECYFAGCCKDLACCTMTPDSRCHDYHEVCHCSCKVVCAQRAVGIDTFVPPVGCDCCQAHDCCGDAPSAYCPVIAKHQGSPCCNETTTPTTEAPTTMAPLTPVPTYIPAVVPTTTTPTTMAPKSHPPALPEIGPVPFQTKAPKTAKSKAPKTVSKSSKAPKSSKTLKAPTNQSEAPRRG